MLRAVIFDHDGTLVDSERTHFQIWREVLGAFGVEFSEAEYAQNYSGLPTRYSARKIVTAYNLDIDCEELFRLKEQKINVLLAHTPFNLMPGATEAIGACKQMNLSLAIASGARRSEIANTLKVKGLKGMFDTTACSEDVALPKPAPDVYLLAMKSLGLKAEQCIAVEDSYSGFKSAKAAGLRCIVVPNAYSADHDFSGADWIVTGLNGAMNAIASIRSQA